ncbi:hypothetical protein [Streptomyces sp. NPDC050355]|uniref:hypothetical protein n=1 Tax=Streptomyces sp. NPDC050355 TaxID=3365609 RepID=UPI00379FFA4A
MRGGRTPPGGRDPRRGRGALPQRQETDLTVEAIALWVGLSSATNLRRRFQQALHTTPAAYHRAFWTTAAGRRRDPGADTKTAAPGRLGTRGSSQY